MIDLTVKTLDSQNHLFSLDDDQITVRGFKEHIAECVEVPADSQRLIYCGRVLQDEKKLNDYDVNGKVIHLVQRAPPQPGQRGNDSGQGQGQSQGHGQNWQSQQRPHHYRLSRAQMHGNAMYLGAMSVPAEIVEGHGLPVPQLSNSLSNSRLIVARRMLHRANMLIDRLDNPTRAANSTTTENSQIPLQEDLEEIGAEDEDTTDNRTNGGTRLAEAAAAAAAIAATFSTVGANNVALLRSNAGDGIEVRVASEGTEDNQTEGQGQQQQQQQQQQEQQQQSQTDQQGVGTNTDSQPNRRIGQQLPRPFQMADLLAGVLHTQARLRPYLEQYYRLMLGDPVLQSGTGPGSVEESQRVVDGVSECMHCLAHACHALSDIIVDMNQQPPRNLRCRPIIIQHSAILQAGIPIQVEAHISLHGRNANNNNVNGETNDPANPQATSESAGSSEPNETNNENTNRQDTSNPASGQESQQQQPQQPQQPQQQQQQQPQQQPEQTQSPFGTVFNLPNSVEVLMELNPEGNVDSGAGSGAQQSAENNNNNYNAGGRIGGNGSGPSVLPWGSTPAPEFLRNLMQAVAGHMVQSSIATTNMTVRNPPVTGQQTVASSVDGTTTNAGQSTQARSNVGTHPTTATQTRSTSRPHVFHQHTHPLGVGMSMGQGFDLDPFLPCNSHHVRRTPSEPPSPATTASQPSHQNQASAQEPQSQPQPATSTSGNTTSTNAAPPTTSQGTANAPLLSLEIRDTDFVQMGNIIRMLNGEGNQGGVMEDGSGSITVQEDITLADLLQTGGSLLRYAATDRSCEQAFLYGAASFVARSITLEDLLRLRLGQWEPIAQLRRSLRTFLEAGFTNTSCTEDIRDQVTERLFSQVKPFLECFLESERDIITRTDSHIDLCSTLHALLLVHGRNALRILFDNDIDDAHFGQEILTIVNNLGIQLCAVLRYSIRGGQASLEAIALRFVGGVLGGVNYLLREWMLTGFIARFRAYSSRIVQPPEAEIIPLLKYESTATPKSPPTGKQDSPQQSEDELMETDVDLKPNNEAPMLEDGEEIPETFPGHETLPSDWVPLIARDGVRQRRQLQMQEVANGGVATFSDAYLGGLPSKRRKLIEQQKPRLLVSPTPNHSAITASVERLVRDSVGRAGVEEVDGATVAVAADPGVRRAFGQAIRDCLNPRRYGTADFPDPLRFPNATRYFADQERPAK